MIAVTESDFARVTKPCPQSSTGLSSHFLTQKVLDHDTEKCQRITT